MKEKILVMDDESVVVRAIGARLDRAGYKPLLALDGKEGLQIVEESSPDLIVTDIVMPGIDGYMFCKRMKAAERTRNIPIVVLTAYLDREKMFRDLGVNEFLTKPCDSDTMMAAFRRALEQSRMSMTHKIVMLQGRLSPQLESTLKQLSRKHPDVKFSHAQSVYDMINDALRLRPQIIILEGANDPGAAKIIQSLKSYVIFRDLKVLVYGEADIDTIENKKERKQAEERISLCIEAGAQRYIGPLAKIENMEF
ncbi:MAG: response regulator [Candidatus Omnitrophica bacterium]|nr:response regulator [Candidatus Omnitrophota bacterium]